MAQAPGGVTATIAERVAAGPREIAFPGVFPPVGSLADPIVGGLPAQVAPANNQIAVTHLPHGANPPAGVFDAGLANYRPKIIGVWNNKGGVSKTTTTHTLGFALAQDPNTRVMMVDVDGQQNLMQMTFRHAVDNQPGVNAGDYHAYIAAQTPANQNCISLEDATRQYRQSNGGLPLGYPHAFRVVDGPGPAHNKRLFLVLAGDDFETVDTTMTSCSTIAGAQAQAVNGVSPFPGTVWHAIWRAGRSVSADIILLDLAPSISALNKNLLMHCDYFVTPCLPEQFSQKALERITLHFGEWYSDFFGQGIPGNSIRGASRGYTGNGQPGQPHFPLPSMRPRFAGCILTGYSASPVNKRTITEVNGGLAVETPNGHAAQRLTAFLILRSQQLAAALQPPAPGAQALPHQATQTSFAVPENAYPNPAGSNFYPQPHVLARIRKAVSGFENATVQFGKPFPFLTDDDLGSRAGINLPNTPELREAVAHYQRIYLDTADFLRNLPVLAHDSTFRPANQNDPQNRNRFNFNLPPNQAALDAGAVYGLDGSGRFR